MAAPGPRPAVLQPPVRLIDLELSRPIPAVPGDAPGAPTSARVAVLRARLHDAPIGSVDVQLPADGLEPAAVAAAIGARLSPAIASHLRADGLDPTPVLTAEGIAGRAACLDELRAFAAVAPRLTVAIPTRDRPERVGACVDAVVATGYPDLEIIVVDNAPSSDATERLFAERTATQPCVRYVRTARAGTAHARNVALRLASSDVVAFLDDDVLVEPGWALAIARPFADDDRVGCVTGMIVAAELETWPQLWIEEYGGFAKGVERRVYELVSPPVDSPLFPYAAGLYGSGASMAFRRQAVSHAGGFDPALGGGTPARGGEDLAAYVDVILDGWRLVYEPRAMVRHFHHREYERLRQVMIGYGSGLGAYLARLAVEHPDRLPDLLTRGGRGLAYLLDRRSPKNARKRADYPAELTRLELLGLLAGPFAYAQGRLALRSAHRRAAARRRATGAAGVSAT